MSLHILHFTGDFLYLPTAKRQKPENMPLSQSSDCPVAESISRGGSYGTAVPQLYQDYRKFTVILYVNMHCPIQINGKLKL